MNIGEELTLTCGDTYLREIEWFLRSNIYKNRHMPADMVVPRFISINKIVQSSGIGISVKEECLSTDQKNHIVSHKYEDILQTDEDIEKLHKPEITYDEAETLRSYHMVGEILGDIIPVKLSGADSYGVVTWDDIARYRGVTNMLIDLVERPEFMHKTVRKLTEISLSVLEQFEELGLFDNDPLLLHCTPSQTSGLPCVSGDGHATRKNIWGRGAAQIFASVSKDMHDEFDISYMQQTIGQCGLSYYGCCEPLDKKIDIVEKIPNLRKISITPWADVNIAAEAIQDRYVLSSKPNPAAVAVSVLDKDNLKSELREILSACKKNNCSCDIVLKDISTCNHRPENIFEWEQIAMDMVKCY